MIHALNLSLGSGLPMLLQSNPQASPATAHGPLEFLPSQSVFCTRTGEAQARQFFSVRKEVGEEHRLACDQGVHLTLGCHGKDSASRSCRINGKPPLVVKAGDSSPNRNFVRVCFFCNTSKTPLWRGGPQGAKSLCNACGIRYRKARRALAAAAAATDRVAHFPANPPILLPTRPDLVTRRRKQCRDPAKFACRKREKLGLTAYAADCVKGQNARGFFHSPSRLSFGESLTHRSAFHQVLPKEEEDAAKLLMALSYGLVHG